jgi:hypothetical protein
MIKKLKPKSPKPENILYIISDKDNNSKIGITSNLKDRLSTYKTHNPNASLYSHYSCPNARDLETIVKLTFRDRLIEGGSREWFKAEPATMDAFVKYLLAPKSVSTTETIPVVAMGKISIPEGEDFSKYFRKEGRQPCLTNEKGELNQARRIVGREFNLGILEWDLPPSVIYKEAGLSFDIYNCASVDTMSSGCLNDYRVRTHVSGTDHTSQYYHLVDLPNGKHIALCSAYITMPYYDAPLKVLNLESDPYLRKVLRKDYWDNTAFKRIQDEANIMGWYAFRQDHWAFWNSDETPLIIVMPKTPISKRIELFNNSFKKWVMERGEMLVQDPSFQGDLSFLKAAIGEIWSDHSFPLHTQTLEEIDDYLKKFHKTSLEKSCREEAYEFLLAKWKGESYTSKAFKQRLSQAFTTWINESCGWWKSVDCYLGEVMNLVYSGIETKQPYGLYLTETKVFNKTVRERLSPEEIEEIEGRGRAQQDKGYQTMIALLSSEGIEVEGGKLKVTQEEFEDDFSSGEMNLYYVPNSDPTQKLRGIYIGKKNSFEEEDEYDESEDYVSLDLGDWKSKP